MNTNYPDNRYVYYKNNPSLFEERVDKTKKTVNYAIIAVCVLLLSGCSQIFPPPIYSSKAMDEVIKDLKKINGKYKIERVIVSENEKLSNEFGFATVYIHDNEGQRFTQSFIYNNNIPAQDPKPVGGHNPQLLKEIKVDDIIKQKDNLEKYVEQAATQILEELEGKFVFRSVAELDFIADRNGDLQIEITLNCTEKGKSSHREGRSLVTDYYSFEFIVDKDGNVTYQDE